MVSRNRRKMSLLWSFDCEYGS